MKKIKLNKQGVNPENLTSLSISHKIEAVKWNGRKSIIEVSRFLNGDPNTLENENYCVKMENGPGGLGNLYLKTKNGLILVPLNCWIVKHNNTYFMMKPEPMKKILLGELQVCYVCKEKYEFMDGMCSECWLEVFKKYT